VEAVLQRDRQGAGSRFSNILDRYHVMAKNEPKHVDKVPSRDYLSALVLSEGWYRNADSQTQSFGCVLHKAVSWESNSWARHQV